MNESRCGTVGERLPDFVGGRLAPADASLVEAHLDECEACREEAALVELVYAARPLVPRSLAPRIERSSRLGVRHATRPWWGLAAASVAAVALGIGVVSQDGTTVAEADVPGFVAGAEESSLWVADDGLVAGAPALDGLSDDALLTLLEEMGSESSGGAA